MNFMFCCYIYSIYNPQWGFCFMVEMWVIWIGLKEKSINFDWNVVGCGLTLGRAPELEGGGDNSVGEESEE